MKKLKVYVGCSLTHAPEEFRKEVEKFKGKLESVCEVLKFKGLTDDTPRDIYLHDINNCVYACDLMVAICDHPSIGLGWEMATQSEKRKMPLLAVAHKDAKVTKLILDPGLSNYEFVRYDDLCVDVFNIIKEKYLGPL